MASFAFYFGITEPLMVFERFFFWEKEASLLDIIAQLWEGESWPLALVVGLFSIVFPLAKLIYLLAVAVFPSAFVRQRWLALLGSLSKWSMLDVLVVALVIVATKTTGLAKATALPGLWSFTLCVVLMALATLWVQRHKRQAQGDDI